MDLRCNMSWLPAFALNCTNTGSPLANTCCASIRLRIPALYKTNGQPGPGVPGLVQRGSQAWFAIGPYSVCLLGLYMKITKEKAIVKVFSNIN